MPPSKTLDFKDPDRVVGPAELTRADLARAAVHAQHDASSNFSDRWWKEAGTSYVLAGKLCKALAETDEETK